MDGYWILSDLTGTVNIHQRTRDWFVNAFRKIIGSKKYNPKKSYQLNPKTETIFKVWSISYLAVTLFVLFTGILKLINLIKSDLSKLYYVFLFVLVLFLFNFGIPLIKSNYILFKKRNT